MQEITLFNLTCLFIFIPLSLDKSVPLQFFLSLFDILIICPLVPLALIFIAFVIPKTIAKIHQLHIGIAYFDFLMINNSYSPISVYIGNEIVCFIIICSVFQDGGH